MAHITNDEDDIRVRQSSALITLPGGGLLVPEVRGAGACEVATSPGHHSANSREGNLREGMLTTSKNMISICNFLNRFVLYLSHCFYSIPPPPPPPPLLCDKSSILS
jgi:hypothetical protein